MFLKVCMVGKVLGYLLRLENLKLMHLFTNVETPEGKWVDVTLELKNHFHHWLHLIH